MKGIDIYLIGCESEPIELDLIMEWDKNYKRINSLKAVDSYIYFMKEIEARIKIKNYKNVDMEDYIELLLIILISIDIPVLILLYILNK